MNFLKIIGTFIAAVSLVALASAPKLPEVKSQNITFDTPLVISVKR